MKTKIKNIDFRGILGYFYPKGNYESDSRPDRDWRILVIAFCLLLIPVVAGNVYLVWKVQKLSELSDGSIEVSGVKQSLLKNAVEEFKQKEEKFEKTLLSKPFVKDPSI